MERVMVDEQDLEIRHDPEARAIYVCLNRSRMQDPRPSPRLVTKQVHDLCDGVVVNIDMMKGNSDIMGIEILY